MTGDEVFGHQPHLVLCIRIGTDDSHRIRIGRLCAADTRRINAKGEHRGTSDDTLTSEGQSRGRRKRL
jgi:hypothetical protein